MKKTLLFICFNFIMYHIVAQSSVNHIDRTTVYDNFQNAVIYLNNGTMVKEKQANIFLKNCYLVYKKNNSVMQANMDNIVSVKFEDKEYLKIDSGLACVIDSISDKKLLCITKIDVETYKTQILNSRQITNLEINNQVNVTTTDVLEDSKLYPLINYYFFKVQDRIIKVHERNILKNIPKDNVRVFKTIIHSPDFSWSDTKYLKMILSLL